MKYLATILLSCVLTFSWGDDSGSGPIAPAVVLGPGGTGDAEEGRDERRASQHDQSPCSRRRWSKSAAVTSALPELISVN